MITLSLSPEWDLSVDTDTKNIAIKESNDAIAQDVASSCRVWLGELPMNIERGINYGEPESLRGTLNFEMREQAKLIDGVTDASVVFDKLDNRQLNATIYISTDEGQTIEVK